MNTPSTKSYACYRFILSRATKRCSCFESGRGGGARFSGTMAKRVREGEGGEIYADSLVMSVCNLHATHGPLMAWLSRVKLSLDASKTREKSFFFFSFIRFHTLTLSLPPQVRFVIKRLNRSWIKA